MRSEVLSSSTLGVVQWNVAGYVQLTFGSASVSFANEGEFETFADLILAEFLRHRQAVEFDVKIGWLTLHMHSDLFEGFTALVRDAVTTLRLMRGRVAREDLHYDDLLRSAWSAYGPTD